MLAWLAQRVPASWNTCTYAMHIILNFGLHKTFISHVYTTLCVYLHELTYGYSVDDRGRHTDASNVHATHRKRKHDTLPWGWTQQHFQEMDRKKGIGCLVAKVHTDAGICAVDVHYVGEWNRNG